MKKIFKWTFAVILTLSVGVDYLTTSAETMYIEFNKTISHLGEIQEIFFSQEVGSSVEEVNHNIRIVSKSGEKFPIDETKTKVENTTITIYPKENYVRGETYI